MDLGQSISAGCPWWIWLHQSSPGATRGCGPLLGVWDEEKCPPDSQGVQDILGGCYESGREFFPPDVSPVFADEGWMDQWGGESEVDGAGSK